ncbi:MAG: hypothetical protein AB2653_01645, partial [Candidatus Thiodiazotropha endolucinida]
ENRIPQQINRLFQWLTYGSLEIRWHLAHHKVESSRQWFVGECCGISSAGPSEKKFRPKAVIFDWV